MIEILFRECCESCTNIHVDWDTKSGYTTSLTTIGCLHMSVCGQYQREEPPPPQDIIVKGFADADR